MEAIGGRCEEDDMSLSLGRFCKRFQLCDIAEGCDIPNGLEVDHIYRVLSLLRIDADEPLFLRPLIAHDTARAPGQEVHIRRNIFRRGQRS